MTDVREKLDRPVTDGPVILTAAVAIDSFRKGEIDAIYWQPYGLDIPNIMDQMQRTNVDPSRVAIVGGPHPLDAATGVAPSEVLPGAVLLRSDSPTHSAKPLDNSSENGDKDTRLE